MSALLKPGAGRHHPGLGQTLVEFALVIPLFLVLLLGLIDLARFVYLNNTLAQVAREGARLASVQAAWIGYSGASCSIPVPDLDPAPGSPCPASAADFRTRVGQAVNRNSVGLGQIDSSQIAISCAALDDGCASGNGSGSEVTVVVSYTFSVLTPIVGQFTNVPLSASATMVIN